jgi:hypothetical protein
MQQEFTPSMAVRGQQPMSVADVVVQLSELSCRLDQLEEDWNDPTALRRRLGQLAAARLASRLQATPTS